MQLKSLRFFLSTFILGSFYLVALGCSVQTHEESKALTQNPGKLAKEQLQFSVDKENMDIQFSKVSLISQEGIELELDATKFQEKWNEATRNLQGGTEPSFPENHTIVGWDKGNQPYVIQVFADGIKIGQDYFQGEKSELLARWLKEYVGLEYLNNLTMERIILEARDLEIKKEMPEEIAEDVFLLIKSSALVKGEARLSSPLYPYYVLDVEYKKDQFLQFIVLSPTLISIEDGQERWFYQLNHSIFSLLKNVIPITHFSEQHIKHLFLAQEILIIQDESVLYVSDLVSNALGLEMELHRFVRIFTSGRRGAKLIQQEDSPQFIVQFHFPDSSRSEVKVHDHYFYFEEEKYDLFNVSLKLQEVIEQAQLNNKQKEK